MKKRFFFILAVLVFITCLFYLFKGQSYSKQEYEARIASACEGEEGVPSEAPKACLDLIEEYEQKFPTISAD